MQLIYKTLELVIDILEIFLIFRFVLYFDMKPIKYYFMPTIIAVLGLILLYVSDVTTITRTIYMILAPMIINLLSENIIQKTHIVYGFLSAILIGTIEDLTLNIIRISSRIFNCNPNRMLAGIFALVITTLLWLTTTYYITHKHYGYLQKRHTSFFVFITFTAAFNSGVYNVFLKCIYATDFTFYTNTKLIECCMLIFAVILIAEIVYIIFLYYEKTHYSIINDFSQEYLEIERAHFKKTQQQEEDTRRFRHDIQEHLTIMNHFAADGKTKELTNYLQSVNESFAALMHRYHTGSDIIDSILNRESIDLEKHHITLEIDGNLGNLNSMEDFALCTIFSNALRNAKEACIQIPDITNRHIFIRFHSANAMHILTFSNTVKENLKLKNNRPVTSKTDKKNHGYGLIQIEQIVNNHNGSLRLTCEDCMFHLVAALEADEPKTKPTDSNTV